MMETAEMTYRQFCKRYIRYKDAARQVIRFRIKPDVKWAVDAEHFIMEVEGAFNDRERNFRRWLALEKCVFRNPLTDAWVAVSVGDRAEAIYHFLLFCKRLNYRDTTAKALTEYLQYLIDRSLDAKEDF